jgi:esterase
VALLYANILGEGPEELLILHGFLGMGDNWKTHARQWATMGYRVHLIDQRNHGRSFWDSTFDYPTLAEDLATYVEHHKISNAWLLGHSMGGKTAMYFSCLYPQKVKGLMVADIGVKNYPPHHQAILAGLEALDRTLLTSRTEADLILQSYVEQAGIRQFLLKNLYRKTPDTLALRVNVEVLKTAAAAIGEALPASFAYAGPVLFLKGALSNYILPDDHGQILAHFPQSSFETIANSGHWLHAENPTEFMQVVNQWMTSTGA